jgi:hypothetical protein
MTGQGIALLQTRLTAKLPATFNPANIIAIISAIVSAISGCAAPTPAALKVKRRGRVALIALKAVREDDTLTFEQAMIGVNAGIDIADEATDPECQLFIADCG